MLTKDDLNSIEKIVKANLEEVTETTNANAGSLMTIEKEIEAYSDALDVERKRINRHDTRLETVENNLNLTP